MTLQKARTFIKKIRACENIHYIARHKQLANIMNKNFTNQQEQKILIALTLE